MSSTPRKQVSHFPDRRPRRTTGIFRISAGLFLPANSGLWRYQDATGWHNLTTVEPVYLSFGSSGDVLAEYPGSMWLYKTGTGWVQVSSFVPS